MTTIYTGTFPRALRSDTVDAASGIGHLRVAFDPFRVETDTETPAERPGWVVAHPDGRTLYAAHEVRHGPDGTGTVVAYRRHPATGALTESGRRAVGGSPCHAAVVGDGRLLVVPCFHGGGVHAFALDDDGGLGHQVAHVQHTGSSVHPVRQRAPHPHGAVADPSGRWLLVPDFGTDRIEVYRVDGRAPSLVHHPALGVSVVPGTGPRHAVFHPGGRWCFVVSELTATLTTLAFDERNGRLSVVAEVAILPDEVPGRRSGAEVLVDRSGRYVYATNRAHTSSGPTDDDGEDCVAWFAVDAASGALRRAGRVWSGGSVPRAAALTEDGRRLLVAHQGSSSVVVFAVEDDGTPVPTGDVIATPVPVALALVAD